MYSVMCKCTDAASLTNTHLTFANYREVIMSCHANEEYYEQRYQDLIEQYESEGYTWEDAERLAYCKLKTEEVQEAY